MTNFENSEEGEEFYRRCDAEEDELCRLNPGRRRRQFRRKPSKNPVEKTDSTPPPPAPVVAQAGAVSQVERVPWAGRPKRSEKTESTSYMYYGRGAQFLQVATLKP